MKAHESAIVSAHFAIATPRRGDAFGEGGEDRPARRFRFFFGGGGGLGGEGGDPSASFIARPASPLCARRATLGGSSPRRPRRSARALSCRASRSRPARGGPARW